MAQVACSKHIGASPDIHRSGGCGRILDPPPQPATELLDTGRYNCHGNSWSEGETEPGGTRSELYQPSSGGLL